MQTIKIGKATANAIRQQHTALQQLVMQHAIVSQAVKLQTDAIVSDAGLKPEDFTNCEVGEENGEPVLKLTPKPYPLPTQSAPNEGK